MKLVCLITGKIEQGFEIAQAWQAAGAPGITVLRTYGLFGLQNAIARGEVELPLMVSSMARALASLIANYEHDSTMLLCVCEDALRDPLIAAAQAVLGDLTEPGHGILFVIDLERALGVVHRSPVSDDPHA